MMNLMGFFKNEDGMGTVEIILIVVVLIALVAIFKNTITSVVEQIVESIGTEAGKVTGTSIEIKK